MHRFARVFAVVAVLAIGTIVLRAQNPPANQAPRPARTPSAELLQMWVGTHNKLIEMAKDFPDDKFDFNVQKDQRTFAANLLHVAGTDYEFMSAIAGKKMGPNLENMENPPRDNYKTRADIVKFLQQVTDDGVALIKQMGDEGLMKEMKSPFGNVLIHVAYAWYDDLEHDGEHYGQLVVYYRANNLVPPESRPRSGQ